MSESQYYYGVGRRKRASARAKFYDTKKNIEIKINGKKIEDYFEVFFQRTILNAITNMGVSAGRFDIFVKGGGAKGQAEACRLAIAKSLVKFDEGYKTLARMHGYLTTDIRKVAPKIAGLRKNRKREQWSKR